MISQGPSVCVFNKDDSQEVLASWLFTQYLLTNDVQNGYARTEGYVPVTTKAQKSAEYLEYLARAGEDYDDYYNVKIEATKLLLNYTDDTFVTPVFNGSTSLRNAAGQMIEEVTKSVRRKEVIDDAYMEELYADMNALHRLNNISTGGGSTTGGKAELGELPATAVALLSMLALTWILMGGYVGKDFLKKKRMSKSEE